MTVTKADLIKSVLEKIRFKRQKRERQQYLFPEFNYEPLTKKRAAEIVDSTFEIIKKAWKRATQFLSPGLESSK